MSSSSSSSSEAYPDLDSPDLSTFSKRFWYIADIIHYRNVFSSDAEVLEAKKRVDKYKVDREKGILKDGSSSYDIPSLRKDKALCDSALHPETGELIFQPGRMSWNHAACTLVCGGMMYFRHGAFQLAFWQWMNQSVNCAVNYCNRSGGGSDTNSAGNSNLKKKDDSMLSATIPQEYRDVLIPYFSATAASVGLALTLSRFAGGLASSNTLFGRVIPVLSGVIPQSLNVAFSRQDELREGSVLYWDEKLEKEVKVEDGGTAKSHSCAISGWFETWMSRAGMALPSMLPVVCTMYKLEPRLTKTSAGKRLIAPLT